MQLLSGIEARPGYTELLRELIRSQILHLVEQLSGIGEESFFVSATKDNDAPHLLGSAKGLCYMQRFTGVQEDFPHYLQKFSDSPEKNAVPRQIENGQTYPILALPKSVGTATSSPDLTGVSEPVKTNSDAMLILQIENVKDETHIENGETFENQTYISEEEVVQEQTVVNASMSNKLFVHIENVNDEAHGESGETFAGQSQIPEREVVQEQTVVDAAVSNDLKTHMETEENQMDIEMKDTYIKVETNVLTEPTESPVKEVSAGNSTSGRAEIESSSEREGQTDIADTLVELPAETITENVDSDDEDSEYDYDEGEFDEMKQEEIFPKLINDFKDIDKGQNKMDISDKTAAENSKDIHTETDTPKQLEQSKKKGSGNKIDVNAELVTKLEEPRIESSNKENNDEIEVTISKAAKRLQFSYKGTTFFLKDILTPMDYSCSYCERECRSIMELKEHEGSHTKEYFCYKCDKDLKSSANLRAHNVNCLEVPQFVKNFVKANLDTSSSQLRSLKKPEMLFECKTCLKTFKYRIMFKKHSCKSSADHRATGPVHSVDNDYPRENHLYTEAEHSREEEKYDMETKDKQDKQNRDQTSEENIGHNTWTHKELLDMEIINKTCPIPSCRRTYLSKGQVREHLVAHTSERPFICRVCKKAFRYEKDQKRHEKIFHGFKPHRKTKSSKVVKIAKKFFAKSCSAKSAGLIQKGVRGSLGETAGPLKKSLRALKVKAKHCETTKQKALLNNCSDEKRKYKCPFCDKRYLSSSHLSEHVVNHTGEKNFKCSLCGLKLLRRSNFPGHKKKCELDNPGKVCYMIRLNQKKRERAQKSSANIASVTVKMLMKSKTSSKKTLVVARKCEKTDIKSPEKEELGKVQTEKPDSLESLAKSGKEYQTPQWLNKQNCPVPYICKICDEWFATANEVDDHMNRKHANK